MEVFILVVLSIVFILITVVIIANGDMSDEKVATGIFTIIDILLVIAIVFQSILISR